MDCNVAIPNDLKASTTSLTVKFLALAARGSYENFF